MLCVLLTVNWEKTYRSVLLWILLLQYFYATNAKQSFWIPVC